MKRKKSDKKHKNKLLTNLDQPSKFWLELFQLSGTKLNLPSAYYPQSNGQTKMVNHTIEMQLRCFVGNHPNEWVCWVPWAEYYYNTTYCTNLPTSILDGYWRRHPHHLSCTTSRTRLAALEDTLQQQDQILTNVHSRFHQAQARMKRQYNEAHREVSFEPSE